MSNHFDSAQVAASVGAELHQVDHRTVKPLFGKPREEYAHMMSHPTPRVAIATIHANLVHAGENVGATGEQRVPNADGFMANLYSFQFTDGSGARHTVHMMRPAGRLEYGR